MDQDIHFSPTHNSPSLPYTSAQIRFGTLPNTCTDSSVPIRSPSLSELSLSPRSTSHKYIETWIRETDLAQSTSSVTHLGKRERSHSKDSASLSLRSLERIQRLNTDNHNVDLNELIRKSVGNRSCHFEPSLDCGTEPLDRSASANRETRDIMASGSSSVPQVGLSPLETLLNGVLLISR